MSHEPQDGAIDEELPLLMPNDQVASTALVNFVVPPEWDAGSAARFDELSEKEALSSATSEEIEELDGLSVLRRRAIVPRTGQEVMREHEQGRCHSCSRISKTGARTRCSTLPVLASRLWRSITLTRDYGIARVMSIRICFSLGITVAIPSRCLQSAIENLKSQLSLFP